MRFRSVADVVAACQIRGRFSPRACSPARSAVPMMSGSSARMLLLDSLDGAQLLFPSPFERARHETVLGLNGIILAPCPLGLVAGAFSPERPLPLEVPALLFQLPYRRERDRNLVGGESIEEEALDERVDRQGADFLTQRTASLVPIDPAAIDRIVATQPRVAQAHATSTTAADRNTL